jgi:hypothetical protein
MSDTSPPPYAFDSYKPVTGSIFVAITVNKNVWDYGFSKFITPWSMKDGLHPPHYAQHVSYLLLVPLWHPILLFGQEV